MNDNVKYKVSVIVVMYNPIPEKLWLTLDSLIHQERVDLEIVIADDGSNNNLVHDIHEYMLCNSFRNYKLVLHTMNQGTVMNCFDGVNKASGDYVKLISPGDFLVCNDVLFQWINHMVNSNHSWSFGEAVYYTNDGNYRTVSRKTHPQNIYPYLKNNEAKCRWNYLVHNDIALGAATIFNRDVALRYLQRIINKVKYAEDNIYRIMMFDGVLADYYPNNVIFYECDTGVSTSRNSKWERLLRDDWIATNKIMISNKICRDALQSKITKQMMKHYSNNKIIRFIEKLSIRGWLYYKLKNLIKPRLSDSNCDVNSCVMTFSGTCKREI